MAAIEEPMSEIRTSGQEHTQSFQVENIAAEHSTSLNRSAYTTDTLQQKSVREARINLHTVDLAKNNACGNNPYSEKKTKKIRARGPFEKLNTLKLLLDCGHLTKDEYNVSINLVSYTNSSYYIFNNAIFRDVKSRNAKTKLLTR
jgi:hypothetical protein